MKIIFIALFQEWKIFYEQHRSKFSLLHRESKEWVYLFEDRILFYQTGMGPVMKLNYLKNIVQKYPVDHILNIGFSALFHANDPIGSLFFPEKIGFFQDEATYVNQKTNWIQQHCRSIDILYTTDRIIQDPDELHMENKPFLVDMEAYYLAEKIQFLRIPFTAIKVVSDYGTRESVQKVLKIHLPFLQKKIAFVLNHFVRFP